MGRELPGHIVSRIGEYLRLSKVDQSNIEEDDEFIAGDLSTDESASESESEEDSASDYETEEEEWDSDYGSDED